MDFDEILNGSNQGQKDYNPKPFDKEEWAKRKNQERTDVNVNTKMYKKGNLFMYKKRNEIVHLI